MIFDSCKKCGSYSFVCHECSNNEYYRHIDDKIKMKNNLKSLKNKRVIIFLKIWNNKKILQALQYIDKT